MHLLRWEGATSRQPSRLLTSLTGALSDPLALIVTFWYNVSLSALVLCHVLAVLISARS
jgi:hypothetical protein